MPNSLRRLVTRSSDTRYHLYVMAIEKMTLLRLNRIDDLKVIDRDYRNGPETAYKRAWEIVNEIEGDQPFIEELKALKGAAPRSHS